MNAAILCPGPSLKDYEHYAADLLIGVNRAALVHEVGVWAAADYPMIRDTGPHVLGTPSLLTKRQTAADLRGRLDRFTDVYIVEDLSPAPPDTRWQSKTLTSAMVFAFTRRAKRINLYGCDWQGEADYDGVKAGEDRTEKRWAQEREDVWELSEWLRGQGCAVVKG